MGGVEATFGLGFWVALELGWSCEVLYLEMEFVCDTEFKKGVGLVCDMEFKKKKGLLPPPMMVGEEEGYNSAMLSELEDSL